MTTASHITQAAVFLVASLFASDAFGQWSNRYSVPGSYSYQSYGRYGYPGGVQYPAYQGWSSGYRGIDPGHYDHDHHDHDDFDYRPGYGGDYEAAYQRYQAAYNAYQQAYQRLGSYPGAEYDYQRAYQDYQAAYQAYQNAYQRNLRGPYRSGYRPY